MPHPIEKQLADRAMALGRGGKSAAADTLPELADYDAKIDRIINRKAWN